MKYPGGKGGAGVYHRIIGLMPPHDTYIEAFVGGGAVLLNKAPAKYSIVIDADVAVAGYWQRIAERGEVAGGALTALHGDARAILRTYPFTGRELVYCDPPYVLSARRGGAIYRHEMTDDDHRELVSLLSSIGSAFMLSGYRNPIYDDAADRHGWRRIDFTAMTRGGPATESLWMNFDAPPKA